jgi:hypothetical protein
MAQHTAVEWLDNELWKLRLKLRGGEVSIKFYLKQEARLILQAEEMFQQQIEAAWKRGDGEHDKVADELSKKYYTETYGK